MHRTDYIRDRRIRRLLLIVSAWTALVVFCVPAAAQKLSVPIELQVPLFTKIAGFDFNFKTRPRSEAVIGIAYQSGQRGSVLVKNDFVRQFAVQRITAIEGLPVTCVPIDLDNDDLNEVIDAHKINILYVAPLRAYPVEGIAAACAARKVMTWTGNNEYLEQGLAVALSLHQDRPQIEINLSAARSEGIDFSARLLKLARIYER